ncbi:MAG TPA: holo-ACP synthase [Armatimonadota bacterium]|jgi:holo-[acyl-carrier protein] synthase
MIIGIGTDLVVISRVEALIERHGDRYLNRIFTARERAECLSRKRSAEAFALRWAAKESVMKALGTGYRRGVIFQDIELFHHASGKPDLRFSGPTADLARSLGVTSSYVTLTHDGDFGLAVVVLEGEPPPVETP